MNRNRDRNMQGLRRTQFALLCFQIISGIECTEALASDISINMLATNKLLLPASYYIFTSIKMAATTKLLLPASY